jgi:anaerobic ribonucleoside-triphosphate reductase activating protein
MQVQVANIVAATEAEGPGRRFALWLQGCPLRCPGCCNPEMLPFTGGPSISVDELLAAIQTSAVQNAIEGITLLGGEPFAHAEVASMIAQRTQAMKLSVMVFSGYTLAELRSQADPAVDRLLAHADILVDGPYQKELPDRRRRWIGSTNQQIHFLSDRYQADQVCWREPNTLEIRVSGGEISVNGFPAKQAAGVWKRPKTKPLGN